MYMCVYMYINLVKHPSTTKNLRGSSRPAPTLSHYVLSIENKFNL